jgi:hypothetical protein
MVILTLKQLCNKSSDIITANVVSINSYGDPQQRWIFTDIELEVNETIKGNLKKQERLTLKLYGGTVNGITITVVGAPRLTVGEHTLLFLKKRQSVKFSRYFTVVGLSQGKFNIFKNAVTQEKMVVREQMQTPLQLETDGLELPLTDKKAIPLSVMLNHIRTYTNQE